MNSMQETVVRLISKSPADRDATQTQLVLPWLHKNNQLLQGVDKSILADVIKYCTYQKCTKNDIIIRQGDEGDSMYIIIGGRCGVYIDASKTGEEELVSTTASDILGSLRRGGSNTGRSSPSVKSNQLSVPSVKSQKKKMKQKGNVQFDADAPDDAAAVVGEEGAKPTDVPVIAIDPLIEEQGQPAVGAAPTKFNIKDYGKYIMTFPEGRCFGELALMTDNSTRNASVIAEGEAHLLVITKDLYNKTLKVFQEADFKARKDFVARTPLFCDWASRFQRLLEMSLIKEVYPPGASMLKQGENNNGLLIITSGQAQVFVEPGKHEIQYSNMTPFVLDNVSDGLAWIRGDKGKKVTQEKHEEAQVRVKLVEVKRKQGYVAVEKLNSSRITSLCMVGPGEVLGDIETVMKMKTYMMSAKATDKVEAYVLNLKNYERLVSQKNPRTEELLKMTSETKLKNRLRSLGEVHVPLFKHLLYNMNRSEQPASREEGIELIPRKKLPDKETLFKHLANSFAKNEAELIQPLVPGSIYIRDVMRERAKVREHMRSLRKQPRHLKNKQKPIRLKRLSAYPRSNKQLMVDLEKQKEARETHERISLVRNIRKLEMVDVRDEVTDSKKTEKSLPNVSVLKNLEPADRHQVEHLVKAEIGIELPEDPLASKDWSDDEDAELLPAITVPNGKPVPMKKVTKIKKRLVKKAKPQGQTETMLEKNKKDAVTIAENLTLHLERTKTFITQIRPESEPDMSRDTTKHDDISQDADDTESTRSGWERVRSAAGLGRTADDGLTKGYILPCPARIPPIAKHGSVSVRSLDTVEKRQIKVVKESKRRETQAKLRFLNDVVRNKLKMAPENPKYRDWETGESSVAHLENRIAKFNKRQAEFLQVSEPKSLPKLTRFTAGDEQPKQPKPGGKVFVKRQECPLKNSEVAVINHKHTRFHMVPNLPDHEKLRRSRMLMQLVVDEIRTNPGVKAKAK